MKVIKLKDLTAKNYEKLIKRSFGNNQKIISEVREIMENVKKKGDTIILKKYQTRYGIKNYRSIKVTDKEIEEAYKIIDHRFIKAIRQMVKNITAVHKVQLLKKVDTVVYPDKGIKVWRVWRAIEKVGLYIPGGKAVYPSSVLMTAIPAQIAGCGKIILCTPPGSDGKIPAATLAAADILGLTEIFKAGGAEAIAAMTYGTKSTPQVYKIFGAGNSYVTCAKLLAFPEVALDMPAGPSEIFIIADETANPAYIAADLLADGEHGKDSACVLLTTSKKIAEETIIEITKQLNNLETKKRAREAIRRYGLIAIVDSWDDAIKFTNNYAPEHLEIMTKNAENIADRISNAGSVFLGNWTTKSAGDYATGANHVLPTGGMAKMYPPLGVEAYGKWMQFQECTKMGLSNIRKTIETLAEVERLPAHKNSTSIRFKN